VVFQLYFLYIYYIYHIYRGCLSFICLILSCVIITSSVVNLFAYSPNFSLSNFPIYCNYYTSYFFVFNILSCFYVNCNMFYIFFHFYFCIKKPRLSRKMKEIFIPVCTGGCLVECSWVSYYIM